MKMYFSVNLKNTFSNVLFYYMFIGKHFSTVSICKRVLFVSPYIVLVSEIEKSFNQAKSRTIENKINKAGLLVSVELNDVSFLKDFLLGYIPNTILLTYKKLAMKMNPNNDREKPYPCKVRDAGQDYGKVRAGTVFPKDWPYTKLFNYNFLRLQEEGILEIIRNKYVPTKVKKCGNHGRNMSQSNLFETMSAFVFLALAQGLASLVFIVEWLSRRDS